MCLITNTLYTSTVFSLTYSACLCWDQEMAHWHHPAIWAGRWSSAICSAFISRGRETGTWLHSTCPLHSLSRSPDQLDFWGWGRAYLHRKCLGGGTNVDHVGQVSLFRVSCSQEHLILLPLAPEWWNFRHVLLNPAYVVVLGIKPRASYIPGRNCVFSLWAGSEQS